MSQRYLTGNAGEQVRPIVIEMNHLAFDRSHGQALRDFSLTVYDGQTIALVGEAGSGKTTLLLCLLQRIQPVSGSIKLWGYPIPPLPQALESSIGVFPDRLHVRVGEEPLTIHAYIESIMHKQAFSITPIQIINHIVQYGLQPDRPVEQLDTFQLRCLGLVSAVVHDPSLVLLDEPFKDLEPAECTMIADYLQRLRQEGRTLLITMLPAIVEKHKIGYDVTVFL